MINAGIVGATGYAGAELVSLLLHHPEVNISAIGSVSFEGQKLEDVYPAFTGLINLPLCSTAEVIANSDVIFLSLPHGHSQEIGKSAIEQGKKVIDLGADFRLKNEEDYTQWYGGTYTDKAIHDMSVYGLPELFSDEIANSSLIANPGCFPTASALGLAPLVKNHPIAANSIVIDAKSGVTGAGRNPTSTTHFPECNENLSPYNLGKHRHTPEIEQTLSVISGEPVLITFSTHLVPANRGILATIYANPVENIDINALYEEYATFYKEKPFVRLMPLGKTVTMAQVKHSNYCDISLHQDSRTGKIIIISAIDNMVKGAAGQAIQNMNIICGLPETTGLKMAPPAF